MPPMFEFVEACRREKVVAMGPGLRNLSVICVTVGTGIGIGLIVNG